MLNPAYSFGLQASTSCAVLCSSMVLRHGLHSPVTQSGSFNNSKSPSGHRELQDLIDTMFKWGGVWMVSPQQCCFNLQTSSTTWICSLSPEDIYLRVSVYVIPCTCNSTHLLPHPMFTFALHSGFCSRIYLSEKYFMVTLYKDLLFTLYPLTYFFSQRNYQYLTQLFM